MEPSLKNYRLAMKQFNEAAINDPGRNYLFI
jgi:hypothetical protein